MDHSLNTIKFMIRFIFKNMGTPAKGDTIDWEVRKALKKAEASWNSRKFGPLCDGCWVEAEFYVLDCDDMQELRYLKKAAMDPNWGYR